MKVKIHRIPKQLAMMMMMMPTMMRRMPFLFLFIGLGSLSAVFSEEEFNPRVVIPKPFAPIVDPEIGTLEEADGKVVKDEELVLGVVVGREARAYPINTLTGPRREIINDRLGGRSIAATW